MSETSLISEQQELLLSPPASMEEQEMAAVHDLPMQISIEVGRLRISIKDFLCLAPNSVLDLKKVAGEPFEVAINGRIVARGEVVMVEECSGVRIVEVLKPSVTS